MDVVQIEDILTKSGYHVLGITPDTIILEDPVCVIRSLSDFIDFAWIALSIITLLLLFGWALAVIRGSSVKSLVENLKNMTLMFGGLAAVPAVLSMMLTKDFTMCKDLSIPVSEINRLIENKEFELKIDMKKTDGDAITVSGTEILTEDGEDLTEFADTTNGTTVDFANNMAISNSGLDFLTNHEGLARYNPATGLYMPYRDAAGFLTVGYGHLVRASEDFGNGITAEQAKKLLRSDLSTAEYYVRKYVDKKITQAQYDALISMAYNIGGYGIVKYGITDCINSGCSQQDLGRIWKSINKSNGKTLNGLINRRNNEWRLFNTGKYFSDAWRYIKSLFEYITA